MPALLGSQGAMHTHCRQLLTSMGDSRICSRGFPGSYVVHGVLARRKFFIINTPTFHTNCCAYDTIAKDSPKVVFHEKLGCEISSPSLTILEI